MVSVFIIKNSLSLNIIQKFFHLYLINFFGIEETLNLNAYKNFRVNYNLNF